ncbi:MAG TPA: o-succinylbenzoate synthase [Gemmatimonadaceae bacterium]|nr:o-succinylbenzoate synthase [Gemmatimonadaceae bacterium]
MQQNPEQNAVRIVRVKLREIELPLAEPFRTATAVVERRRIILLEITDADGVSAWSECVAGAVPSYSPETVDGAWRALSELIIPISMSKAFALPRHLHFALDDKVRGNHMARAAVEMGAWAVAATRANQSLAARLAQGSTLEGMPRESVETGIAVGMQVSTNELIDRVRNALAEGYRRIKLKVSPGNDVEIVREVRNAVGESAPLSVDANGSYSLGSAADMVALKALDAFGLVMIEQPLGRDDLVGHARLQRMMKTSLCLDESVLDDPSVEDIIALGSGRIINLKPGRVGGFTEALAIHDRCARADVPVWCGGMLECGIGRAYNVALASLPNFSLPGDLSPSARYWQRDVITSPWTMDSSGNVRVPLDQVGIGVVVDTDYVDELTVREASFSKV